jgi:hypothetical protein
MESRLFHKHTYGTLHVRCMPSFSKGVDIEISRTAQEALWFVLHCGSFCLRSWKPVWLGQWPPKENMNTCLRFTITSSWQELLISPLLRRLLFFCEIQASKVETRHHFAMQRFAISRSITSRFCSTPCSHPFICSPSCPETEPSAFSSHLL